MFNQIMRLAGNVLKGSNLDPQGQAQRQLMAARASNLAKTKDYILNPKRVSSSAFNVTVLPSAMGNPAVLREQISGPSALYSHQNMPAVPINPGMGPVVSTDPAVLRRMADEGRI
jgi:hypothetical protein